MSPKRNRADSPGVPGSGQNDRRWNPDGSGVSGGRS